MLLSWLIAVPLFMIAVYIGNSANQARAEEFDRKMANCDRLDVFDQFAERSDCYNHVNDGTSPPFGVITAIILFGIGAGSLVLGHRGLMSKNQQPAEIMDEFITPPIPTAPQNTNTFSPPSDELPSNTDVAAELQKAADMRTNGLIGDEEYKQIKAKIISKA